MRVPGPAPVPDVPRPRVPRYPPDPPGGLSPRLHADVPLALTFDDALLVPRRSEVLPRDVDVSARLTDRISLKVPLLSSAVDAVTEAPLAIAMANQGGLGILHKNASIETQADWVRLVKRAGTGIIADPVSVSPDATLDQARAVIRANDISGVPVVVDGRAVGIPTNRDLRFERGLDRKVHEAMSTSLITVPPGTGLETAKDLLQEHKIEKLLVVDAASVRRGLITIKDIENLGRHPHAVRDARGRLLCGAAVGVSGDRKERAAALIDAGVYVLVVDTADGHSQGDASAVFFESEIPGGIDLVVSSDTAGAMTAPAPEWRWPADACWDGVRPDLRVQWNLDPASRVRL